MLFNSSHFTPIMLSHNDLLYIASLLGYSNPIGMCRGFSCMWIQAVCAGGEALKTFNRRLALLEKLRDDIYVSRPIQLLGWAIPLVGGLAAQGESARLHQKIDAAWKKSQTQGFEALDETEKNLYELHAFFDGVQLYQSPYHTPELFQGKRLQQWDAPEVSEYTISQALEKQGGLHRGVSSLDLYSQKTLTDYLTKMSDTLKDQPNVAIVFAANGHSVAVRSLPDGTFELVDTNHLHEANQRFTPEQLAQKLQNSAFKTLDRGRSKANNAPLVMCTEIYTAGNQHLKPESIKALSASKEKIRSLVQSQDGKTLLHDLNIDVDRFDFTAIPAHELNVGDSGGNTALHYATDRNNLNLMNLLIEKGADVNARNRDGYNPLDSAISNNNWDAVKILINHSAVCIDTIPLMTACVNNRRDLVPELLERTPITPEDLKPNSRFHTLLQKTPPDLQQAVLKKALQSYLNIRDVQPEMYWGDSKKTKMSAAKALLDHMEGKDVDLKPHHGALNEGRLKEIYQRYKANKPTDPEPKPDEGKTEQP